MSNLAIRNRILSFGFRRRKDPFLEMLESAPLDDEPVTEDDLRSLEEGWQDYLAGNYVTSDEIKRRYREQGRSGVSFARWRLSRDLSDPLEYANDRCYQDR
jgi:hypothetical protein